MCELGGSFSFDAPFISGVAPMNLGIDASVRFVTVLGSNFGTQQAADNAQIRLGNMLCDSPTWMSSSSINCAVSDRLLRVNDAVIVIDSVGGTSSGLILFSFDAPRIDRMLPANGPTTASVHPTIFGANFLPLQMYATSVPKVTLGQTDCTEVSYITPTKITCLVGAGTGAGHSAVVRSSGLGATIIAMFKYDSPILTSMLPTNLPYTAKAASIFLAGTNFGGTPPEKAISADGLQCERTVWISATSLGCTLNVHGDFEYRLNVEGIVDNLSFGRQFFMSWDSPVITSAFPPNVPASGGVSVTIAGLNFGLPSTAPNMYYAALNQLPRPVNWTLLPYFEPGTLATANKLSGSLSDRGRYAEAEQALQARAFAHISGTSITLLPATGGAASSQPVLLQSVDVPAREIGPSNTFAIAYDDPVVTAFRPRNAAVFGGISLTVLGTNFGVSARSSLSIRLGSSECAQVIFVSNTALECSLPAGHGEIDVSVGIGSYSRGSRAFQSFAYNDDHQYRCGPYGRCSHSCTPDDGTQPTMARNCSCFETLTSIRLEDDLLCAAQRRPVEVQPCPFVQCPPLLLSVQPSNPLPNSPVTLVGRYFGNSSGSAILVQIGLTSCAGATWLSASSITCQAPFISGGMGTTVKVSVNGAIAQHIAAEPVAMLEVLQTALEVNSNSLSTAGYAQATLSWQSASGAQAYEPQYRLPILEVRRRVESDASSNVTTIPDNTGCLLNGLYEPSDAVCRDPLHWTTDWRCFPSSAGGCLRLASDQLNFTIPDSIIPLASDNNGPAQAQVLLRVLACTDGVPDQRILNSAISSQGPAKAGVTQSDNGNGTCPYLRCRFPVSHEIFKPSQPALVHSQHNSVSAAPLAGVPYGQADNHAAVSTASPGVQRLPLCTVGFIVASPVAWTPHLLQVRPRANATATESVEWPEWLFTVIPVAILLTLIASGIVHLMTVFLQRGLPGGCCLFGMLESVQLVALLCQTCIFQNAPGLAKLAHALRWYNLQIPDLFGPDFLALCSVDQCARPIDAKWGSYSGAAWLSSSILVAASLGASCLLSLLLYFLRRIDLTATAEPSTPTRRTTSPARRTPSPAHSPFPTGSEDSMVCDASKLLEGVLSHFPVPRLQLAVLVLGFNSQVLTSARMISTEIGRFDRVGPPLSGISLM
jgi:hypothetical protein